MIKLDTTNFSDINKDKPVLVKFGAIWCGPCRALSQTLKGLETDEYPIYEVDVDATPDIANKYKIASIPTLAIFKNGEMVKSHSGPMSKDDIVKFVKEAE